MALRVGKEAGRGRKRFRGLEEFRGCQQGKGAHRFRRVGKKRRRGEYEMDGRCKGSGGLMTARHGAGQRVAMLAFPLMFTLSGRFRGRHVARRGRVRIRMGVSGAKPIRAAAHSLSLVGCCPQGSPEQHDGQETHPRAEFSSRSDRNAERMTHRLKT